MLITANLEAAIDDAVSHRPTRQDPVRVSAHDIHPGHYIPAHAHEWVQVNHVVRGIVQVITDGATWLVPPSRGLLIPAGLPHRMQVLKAGYERTLYLRSSRLNRFRGCIVFEVSPLLRELIGALEVATDRPARFRRLIHSLIVEEVDRAPQLPIRITFPEDPRLRRVCDAVIMRRGKPLELAEAAALAAMSSRTLSRLFLDRTGASYGQWCQQVMLSFAIEDLCQGASVAEVAHSLGYASQSAFTTMFRKNMGESPKRFASNHGQGGAGP